MSISVIIPVYNEENRIEATIKTLLWCDEILVLDKNSTDKTREIAKTLGAKVFLWPETEYDPNEITYLIDKCSSEWVLTWTASDIIQPALALKIKELTKINEFEYDILSVPFYTYILGLDSKRSPWHTDYKPYIFRKNSLNLNLKGVHDAINFKSKKIFQIERAKDNGIYHLTHSDVDTMMERHTRYWRAEAKYFEESDLKKPMKSFLYQLFFVMFRRKSFLMGRNGIMLIFAFLSYYMMSYVYKWEKKYSNAPDVYKKMRNDILSEWEKVKY